MLLCLSSSRTGLLDWVRGVEGSVDLAGGVSLEAASDLAAGLALGGAPLDVGTGLDIVAHPGQDDGVQRPVQSSVAAAIEPVSHGVARGCWDRAGAGDLGHRGLAADPAGMRPHAQHDGCGDRPDPGQLEKLGCLVGDDRGELLTVALQLDVELKSNREQLTAIVTDQAPELLELPGVGAITAAVVLCVWSHPGRVRSEAAMAQIAGTCPIPASSGNTVRHRLNRGGDRRLNWALNTVVLTRMRDDVETRAYVERRTAEGKTRREIRRCLKRYTTRQIYRTLNAAHPIEEACPAA